MLYDPTSMNKPTVKFLNQNCTIQFTQYNNTGRTAIQLRCEDGSPMGVATLNVPEIPVQEGNVLIKNYSENTGMLDALIEAGVVGSPVSVHFNGFVDIPECPLLVKP